MPTPIEKAINIGPKCGPEISAVGVETLEKLRELGWEDCFRRICTAFPDRIHTMYAYALIGAETGRNFLSLDEDEKLAAQRITKELRRDILR